MPILIRIKNQSKQDLENLVIYLESCKLVYEIETEADFKGNSQIAEQRQKEIEHAKKIINSMSFSEREYFDSKQKVKRDEMAILQTAVENAKEKSEIATKLKQSNKYSIDEMMLLTGLSKEQIDDL